MPAAGVSMWLSPVLPFASKNDIRERMEGSLPARLINARDCLPLLFSNTTETIRMRIEFAGILPEKIQKAAETPPRNLYSL